jgi:creatinine amidohydrolase
MVMWSELSSDGIKEEIKKNGVVIVPIGATEQHGPHLPTGTDSYTGFAIAKKVAEELNALLLPNVPFGFSEDHCPKPGTVTLSMDTLKNIIRDVAKSLARDGAKHIIIFSGHGGQITQIADVCYELNVSGILGNAQVHNISPWNSTPVEALAEVLEEEVFLHAEEMETSLMLLLRPELVDMSKAVKEIPDYAPRGLTTANFLELIRIFTTSKFLGRDLKTGVCGDPTIATREKGIKLLEIIVNWTLKAINNAIRF